MSILCWVLLGGIAGWMASLLMREQRGCLANILVGIIGAMLGGFIFEQMGERPLSGFSMWSLFIAVLGSIVLLAFFRALRGPSGD
jgi:uncharacterized membrane protein YeaQ/YmgE (transglycosylase-associated protein family)